MLSGVAAGNDLFAAAASHTSLVHMHHSHNIAHITAIIACGHLPCQERGRLGSSRSTDRFLWLTTFDTTKLTS